VVQIDQVPGRGGSRELGLQPKSLNGCTRSSIRFESVTISGEEVDGSPDEIVVTFVAGQSEIIHVRLERAGVPVVVAGRREETINRRAGAVRPNVGINELVIKLPDILINRIRPAERVIVVAGGDDEIRVPAFDEVRDSEFIRSGIPVIADDGEADGSRWDWRYRWAEPWG